MTTDLYDYGKPKGFDLESFKAGVAGHPFDETLKELDDKYPGSNYYQSYNEARYQAARAVLRAILQNEHQAEWEKTFQELLHEKAVV